MAEKRLLLFDVDACGGIGGFSEVTIGDGIEDYYKHLKCDTFDIVHRKVGDRYFDIFCDDEGLLKERVRVSALSGGDMPALVGNLIFANHDFEGETTSLTDEDIELIRNCMVPCMDLKDGDMHNVIYPVEY